MGRQSEALLEAFEQLPLEEKRLLAVEVLRRAARAEMDREDVEDARAALAELGEDLSLEEVKKELGL